MRLKQQDCSKRTKFGFFENTNGRFRKKPRFFFKIAKWGKSFVECESNAINPKKCLLHINCAFLDQNQKLLKVGKIRKYHEEADYLKKRFHLSKRHLNENGRAENMLVVAGRLAQVVNKTAICQRHVFHPPILLEKPFIRMKMFFIQKKYFFPIFFSKSFPIFLSKLRSFLGFFGFSGF